MRRIAIVGPECSGKTTLAGSLAEHYRCMLVKEYARRYLEERGPRYTEEDLLHIAGGQLLGEGEATQYAKANKVNLLICDTDMITVKIWSDEVYGRSHKLLDQLATDVAYDLWLLCKPDIPWEPDPLRENPHDRDRLFTVYMDMLDRLKKPYVIMSGGREERLKAALKAIAAVQH